MLQKPVLVEALEAVIKSPITWVVVGSLFIASPVGALVLVGGAIGVWLLLCLLIGIGSTLLGIGIAIKKCAQSWYPRTPMPLPLTLADKARRAKMELEKRKNMLTKSGLPPEMITELINSAEEAYLERLMDIYGRG